jgi:glycosyltransferase 2 family protein
VKRSAQFLLVLKLLLSLALLAVVLARVHPSAIVDALARADPWIVAGWYALFPLMVLLSAWRWNVLASGLSFATALKYSWIGVFFGHVLPGAIAGDVAKGVSLALKDADARRGLAASIVAEKAIGLAALVVFFDLACAVVWLYYGNDYPELRFLAKTALVLSVAGIFAAGVAVRFAFRVDRQSMAQPASWTVRAIDGTIAATRFYARRPQVVVRAFAISLIIHLVNIIAFYLSFKALRLDAGLAVAAVVYPVVSVMLMIPISISGIGVRDATLAVLFALFGLPAASGVAISWLTLLSTIPNVAIGGAVQLYEMHRKH